MIIQTVIEKLERERVLQQKTNLLAHVVLTTFAVGGSIPLRPCLTPGDDVQESVDKSQFQLCVNAATTACVVGKSELTAFGAWEILPVH